MDLRPWLLHVMPSAFNMRNVEKRQRTKCFAVGSDSIPFQTRSASFEVALLGESRSDGME